MKLGIYGGTFDPPHLGHMTAAGFAIQSLKLDKLLLIPTFEPPHKETETAPAHHRLAMTELMADALAPRRNSPAVVEASDLEISRGGKSYTYETVERLRQEYPGAELWLIMGSDMFLTLHQWVEPERFLQLVKVAAFSRIESDTDDMLHRQGKRLKDAYGLESVILSLPARMVVSSTELRERINPSYLLPQIYGYILRHKLYGVDMDLKQLPLPELRAVSDSWMRARRVPHVRGTEETAAWLAERYGADVEQARRAAILHDITKYKTYDEQLKLVEEYDMMLDDLTLENDKLLHAKTGAAIAAAEYGAGDDIASAIFWHTTGRANMTLLEKIIYLADFIEPTRDFEGVEPVRELAPKDLDQALCLALEQTIEEKLQEGSTIHPDTQQALESLKEGHA